MLLPVLADVARVEPLGQHGVGLHRPDLPGTADRVRQVELQLGRIESAFARKLLPAELLCIAAGRRNGVAQALLGPVPHLVGAEALVRT